MPCHNSAQHVLIENVDQAATFMSTLANNRRLSLLYHLVNQEMSVSALAKAVGIKKSALSRHLAILRNRDLVSRRRQAQSVYYRISAPEVAAILNGLSQLCGSEGSQ